LTEEKAFFVSPFLSAAFGLENSGISAFRARADFWKAENTWQRIESLHIPNVFRTSLKYVDNIPHSGIG